MYVRVAIFAILSSTPLCAQSSRVIYGTAVPSNLGQARGIADRAGNTYTLGLVTNSSVEPPISTFSASFTGFSADGSRIVFSQLIDTHNALSPLQGLAIGAKGEIYAAIASTVFRFAPAGALLGSKAIGGQITAITVDAAGFLYVTGHAENVQTTPGGLDTGKDIGTCLIGPYVLCGTVFVEKLAPDLSAIVYTAAFGGYGFDIGLGIAVDSSGSAYVTGRTLAKDFPVTDGAFQTKYTSTSPPTDVFNGGNAFLARIDPTGSRLMFSTCLGGSGSEKATGIALDSSNNVYVVGTTSSADFPVTTGAYSTTSNSTSSDAFFAKFDSTGKVAYSSFSGLDQGGFGGGLALSPDGQLYFAVNRPKLVKLGTVACDPRATTLLAINTVTGLVENTVGILGIQATSDGPDVSVDGAGIVHVVGRGSSAGVFAGTPNAVTPTARPDWGFLARVDFSKEDAFLPTCMINAASGSLNLSYHAAPGEIISIFGLGLGPASGVATVPDPAYPLDVQGTRVRIGNTQLPLLYASDSQINAIVPYSVPPGATAMIIERGTYQAAYTVKVVPYNPAFFTTDATGGGQIAAINQDGTINSSDNRAPSNSIVSLFVTGLGALATPLPDNLPTPLTPQWPAPLQTFQVSFPYRATISPIYVQTPLDILYIGPAPTLAPGVYQINVRISPMMYPAAWTLQLFPQNDDPRITTIWVR